MSIKTARSVSSLLVLLITLLSACQIKQSPTAPLPPPPANTAPAPGKVRFKLVDYSALSGWQQDDLNQAWQAFVASCTALNKKSGWKKVCDSARQIDLENDSNSLAVRHFFESFFNPYQVINPDGDDTGLITGYYEPLLNGARKQGGKYQTPLYKTPPDLLTIDMAGLYPELKGMRLRGRVVGSKVLPYFSRAELLDADRLAGQEICWVDDSVAAFFLQVQGSGRVFFTESNETVRLAYANQNGHPYKSIGRYLIDQGELKLEQASAQGIRHWISQHPLRENEVLNANPSYVFFKEEVIDDPSQGPKGALGVPLTEKRSIAVDARFIPLGAPVFLSTTQPNSTTPLNQLMLAQDTGGAIRGAVRADFFWGFGAQAGEKAGRMKQRGKLWVLWPKESEQPLRSSQ